MSLHECAAFDRSAIWYDDFYLEKDYREEAAIYARHLAPAQALGNTLVEWGCGTGNFTRHWSRWGWNVIGIEPHAAMRAIACSKGLQVIDGCLASAGPACHAAVACFAVMSYACKSQQELTDSLQLMRAAMPSGGRVVFDVINAVAAERALIPYQRRCISIPRGNVERVMNKQFDSATRLLTTEITFHETQHDQAVADWRELHLLRAFTTEELEASLTSAQFTPVAIGPFPEESADSSAELSWYLLAVGEAR